jgi:hypothetical protein
MWVSALNPHVCCGHVCPCVLQGLAAPAEAAGFVFEPLVQVAGARGEAVA